MRRELNFAVGSGVGLIIESLKEMISVDMVG